MIKFSLVQKDPIKIWKEKFVIEPRDILEWVYTFNLGFPHELTMKVSPTYSKYDVLERTNIGIRMRNRDSTIDLIFEKIDSEKDSDGAITLTLSSSLYSLNFAPLRRNDERYLGSLSSFVDSISGNYIFIPISGDKTIQFDTGKMKNFEKIDKALKKPEFYTYLEYGVREVSGALKTVVLFGNFADSEKFYYDNSTQYPALKPLKAISGIAGFIANTDTVTVGDISVKYNDFDFNHVHAYKSTGGGSNDDTIVSLDPSDDYIRSDYPVIVIDGLPYVKDTYKNMDGEVRVTTYSPQGASADETGGSVTDYEARKSLYLDTIAYCQSAGSGPTYSIPLETANMKLPGIKVHVTAKKSVRNADGSIRVVYDLQSREVIPAKLSGDGNTTLN